MSKRLVFYCDQATHDAFEESLDLFQRIATLEDDFPNNEVHLRLLVPIEGKPFTEWPMLVMQEFNNG